MVLTMPATVLVLGAGMSGLAAAHELSKWGCEVHVFEARGRAGGRVQTLTAPFADGMYADAGAMSFPDNHLTVLHYVREFDLPVDVDHKGGDQVFTLNRRRVILNGGPEDWPVKLTPEEKKLGYNGIYEKYLGAPAKALGDITRAGWPYDGLSDPVRLRELDNFSVTGFLQSQGASDGAIELLSLGLMDFYGEGFDSCSALFILISDVVAGGFSNVFRVRGGQEELPKRIADRLNPAIHYGSAVTDIEATGTGVTIRFNRNGVAHTHCADYLVCAIPFPLLREIRVMPAFSPEKAAVIQNLQNTSVTRVYVQTASRVWEAGKLPGDGSSTLPVSLVFPGYTRPLIRGIIESYSAGPRARELAQMAEDQRNTLIVRELTELFPGLDKVAESCVTKVWDEDPWARGAYAWYRPGTFLKYFAKVATAEGRIHFAGDQTTLMPGWMEGALQSGIRAAQEIHTAECGKASAAGAA